MYPGTHARQTPDKAAVVIAETGQTRTYAELDDNSARLAHRFQAAGLRPGDVVALLSDNRLECFDVYWAALRSGLYITAINRHLAADEVAYIVNNAQAKVFIVGPEFVPVLDAIAGFPIHRGILGLGACDAPPAAADLLAGLPPRALVLSLHGLANHDNVGAIFRNAAAFDVDAVLLDERCCDPLYRKALRVSVGAALTVPFARLAAGEDVLALLQAHGFEPLALTPRGRERLSQVRRSDRMAVLLGAEGPGLGAALIAGARSVRIPMAGGFDSLNVATTSGIVLHQLTAGDR